MYPTPPSTKPSGFGAYFLEGRCHCRGTFRVWGFFSGRSVPLQVDLPCQRLFSRKVSAIPGGPSMPGAVFPEGRCHCRWTFHARGCFPGRSVPFQGDLPCQGPFFRKVGVFFGGPSGPGAVFPEGRCHFRGTFHARSHFPGRSVPFRGDLPCQRLFSRKVRAIPGGPSGFGAYFLEGRCHSRGTFHARGCFPGRSVPFQGDLPCQGPFLRKVLRFSGGPSMPEAVFKEGPAFFRGTFHARGCFPGRSVPFRGDLPCQRLFSRKVGAIPGGPSMPEAVFPEGRLLGARCAISGTLLLSLQYDGLEVYRQGVGACLLRTVFRGHFGMARGAGCKAHRVLQQRQYLPLSRV